MSLLRQIRIAQQTAAATRFPAYEIVASMDLRTASVAGILCAMPKEQAHRVAAKLRAGELVPVYFTKMLAGHSAALRECAGTGA